MVRLLLKILFGIIALYILALALATSYMVFQRKFIRELFMETVDVLNKGGINYWVDFGTLLGIHREKDIILGDNDADICVPTTEAEKLKTLFQSQHSLEWRKMHWSAFRTYKKTLFGKKIFFIDLYLVTVDADAGVVRIPTDGNVPIKYLTNFEKVTMPVGNIDVTFIQPTDWENLLVYRYGRKWTVKTNKWYLGYISLPSSKKPIN